MQENELLPQPFSEQNPVPIPLTRLTAGVALAVQQASAATIATDHSSLEAGKVSIPVRGGNLPGYRVMRSGSKRLPVLLVVSEISGGHEYMQDVCRRLAKLGYLAIVPEWCARQGDVSSLRDIQEINTRVLSGIPDHQFGQPHPLHPRAPHEMAKGLKAPVLGFYGDVDQGIAVRTVEQMRQVLRDADKPSESILYPGAGHGFHAGYRASHHQPAAEDAWRRLQVWFQSQGVA